LYALGRAYAEGLGVPQDHAAALTHLAAVEQADIGDPARDKSADLRASARSVATLVRARQAAEAKVDSAVLALLKGKTKAELAELLSLSARAGSGSSDEDGDFEPARGPRFDPQLAKMVNRDDAWWAGYVEVCVKQFVARQASGSAPRASRAAVVRQAQFAATTLRAQAADYERARQARQQRQARMAASSRGGGDVRAALAAKLEENAQLKALIAALGAGQPLEEDALLGTGNSSTKTRRGGKNKKKK
jgi:hypothetical protein